MIDNRLIKINEELKKVILVNTPLGYALLTGDPLGATEDLRKVKIAEYIGVELSKLVDGERVDTIELTGPIIVSPAKEVRGNLKKLQDEWIEKLEQVKFELRLTVNPYGAAIVSRKEVDEEALAGIVNKVRDGLSRSDEIRESYRNQTTCPLEEFKSKFLKLKPSAKKAVLLNLIERGNE